MAVQFELIPSTFNFQSTADPIIIQVSESTVQTWYKYRFILQVLDESDNVPGQAEDAYVE
jgi:hypothetical protein